MSLETRGCARQIGLSCRCRRRRRRRPRHHRRQRRQQHCRPLHRRQLRRQRHRQARALCRCRKQAVSPTIATTAIIQVFLNMLDCLPSNGIVLRRQFRLFRKVGAKAFFAIWPHFADGAISVFGNSRDPIKRVRSDLGKARPLRRGRVTVLTIRGKASCWRGPPQESAWPESERLQTCTLYGETISAKFRLS